MLWETEVATVVVVRIVLKKNRSRPFFVNSHQIARFPQRTVVMRTKTILTSMPPQRMVGSSNVEGEWWWKTVRITVIKQHQSLHLESSLLS